MEPRSADDSSRTEAEDASRTRTRTIDAVLESEPPVAPLAKRAAERRRVLPWQLWVIVGGACVGGLLGFISAKRAARPATHAEAALTRRTADWPAPRPAPTLVPADPLAKAPEPPQPDAIESQPAPQPRGPLDRPNEAALLTSLRTDTIVGARRGAGGRSLAFKLNLASGISAYFKPEQSVSSAHWYAELAAYYLDRALGLGRVPPVVGRSLEWSSLRAAAVSDERISELAIRPDGQLRGALIFWLNEHLVPAVTPAGWESWVRSEPFPRSAVSPYQRGAAYGAALAAVHARRERGEALEAFYQSVPAPARPELPAELSDMIVFDFLTLNYDRFGGDNANVLLLGESGPLIFLDNGDGFSPGPPRRSLLDARLAPLSRFRKRTIEALRAFDIHAFGKQLARDPLAPILDAQALSGLAARREIVLEHVAAQQTRYGDAVFAW